MRMREKCRAMMGRSLDLFHKSESPKLRLIVHQRPVCCLTSSGPDRHGFPQTLHCLFSDLICLIAM